MVYTYKTAHEDVYIFQDRTFLDVAGSDVPGWASSPEPTEPSLFKPKPGPTRMRA